MKDKNGKPYNRLKWQYVIWAVLGMLFLNSWLGLSLIIGLVIECLAAIWLDARIVKEDEK